MIQNALFGGFLRGVLTDALKKSTVPLVREIATEVEAQAPADLRALAGAALVGASRAPETKKLFLEIAEAAHEARKAVGGMR
jgi:hypothetical protein